MLQGQDQSESANELDAIARTLAASERVLVTMHRGPDGDALGSSLGLALALEEAGKQALVYSADGVPPALRFIPGAEKVVKTVPPDARFDATVTCDSGDASRLGPDVPGPDRRGVFINLDHHATTQRFGDLNFIDVKAASVGVIVFRLLARMGLPLTADAASGLYVSLLADTGSFRYSNTGPEALRIAAELVAAGAQPHVLASAIWESNTPKQLKLLELTLPTLELLYGGRVAMMSVQAAFIHEAGTSEETADGFVSYPRSIAGVDVALLLREEKAGWRVSLRSRGRVDVAKVASQFGGGGHAAAAGCSLVGTADEVRQKLLSAVADALPA